MWFDFHIRQRGENIAKGLPTFSKNWMFMQNLKHLCYEILNFTFNFTGKNEQSLKQHCHLHQKI